MYVRMFDKLKKQDNDNPTIGIILCSDTDNDIARYSILNDKNNLYMSKYKIYLPTEEELKKEIENQKTMFYLNQKWYNEYGDIINITAVQLSRLINQDKIYN